MKSYALRTEDRQPGLLRICFDSLAPVHLLLRLIRSADPLRPENPALRTEEFVEGHTYCLVDARIDDEMRCATIFQVSPKYRLILGGVYLAKSLELAHGLAYLEFLRNPKHAADPDTAANHPPRPIEDSNQQTINSALSVLLLDEGAVLRSAMLDDLTHLTAEQNYVRLHLANGENVVVRGPLQKYENVLPDCFIRASRHVIINLSNLQRLRRVSRDLGVVYFAGSEHTVRLGRKASIAVRTALMSRSSLLLNRAGRLPRKATTEETSG